jgi:hypothetical protein
VWIKILRDVAVKVTSAHKRSLTRDKAARVTLRGLHRHNGRRLTIAIVASDDNVQRLGRLSLASKPLAPVRTQSQDKPKQTQPDASWHSSPGTISLWIEQRGGYRSSESRDDPRSGLPRAVLGLDDCPKSGSPQSEPFKNERAERLPKPGTYDTAHGVSNYKKTRGRASRQLIRFSERLSV